MVVKEKKKKKKRRRKEKNGGSWSIRAKNSFLEKRTVTERQEKKRE